MLKYHVHIVPKNTPNADSHVIEVTLEDDLSKRTWSVAEQLLIPHVPEDHFIVKYKLVREMAQ